MNLTAKLLCLAVRLYQLTLSWTVTGSCRYEPNCSTYTLLALKRHGAIEGSRLAAQRLMRCHPWGRAGYDPVPNVLDLNKSGDN